MESFQIAGEKLGFGIYTNLNRGIWPDLESFPNSQGKIGIWDLHKSQLGVV